MKKLGVILLVVLGLALIGCTEEELQEAEFWGFGISPVATPTPTPDLDKIQSDVDDWLNDYLSNPLW